MKTITKPRTVLMHISALPGTIEIYSNMLYVWAGQKGFFAKEDDNLFAWMPGPEGQGTPSYFNKESVQHICDNHGVPTISK